MEIKFGEIKYFTLVRLKEILNSSDLNRLGLVNYDKLKNEVEMKIEEINYTYKHKNDCLECEGHGIIENSFMTCFGCNGTGKKKQLETK